jgi:glutaminase
MMERPSSPRAPAFVSTGLLPEPEIVQSLLREAYDRHCGDMDGEVSRVYPALARVDPDLFGVSVVGVTGRVYSIGDAAAGFTIMSAAKPFVFALVCDLHGPDALRERIGVNATGRAFNSLSAVEQSADGRTNPMVNSGAIATTSLVPGEALEERWAFLLGGLSRFAGRELELDDEVYASASATNHRNQAIAQLLQDRQRIAGDSREALDLYTRQSSVRVTATDLAVMGATLADGGVNPVTAERVISAETCRHTLAVMTTAGLYETSGDWLYDVGLPGKSGIGGGIVTVAPGKGGLGTFAPRLDAAGNSIRGRLVARDLSRSLGLDLFASEPARRSGT